MTAVYRLPVRRPGRSALLLLAALCPVLGSCSNGRSAHDAPKAPPLQPRRFELADFLASTATGVDSPAAPRLASAKGAAWTSQPSPPQPPTLAVAPAGFRIAAVAPRGDRVAFVRDVDPDTTEVLLYDRSRGETRLLLPVDRDGRFLPQRFSEDGKRLYLLADDGDDTLQLDILNLDSGERLRRSRPGCETLRLDSSPDGDIYALQWSCSGRVEAALFDTATGAALGPLPLPADTRLARALPAGAAGGALYEIASARFPRDLMVAERLDPDVRALPLSFGLAPAIAAADLVDPAAAELPIAGAPSLPAELWWPRRPAASPPALIWLENGAAPPAWLEFDPFLQFLANRGVAVLRLRPRGSQGFGKRFRHAGDGRLVEAGLEDLDAARSELVRRGADPAHIAIVGEGPWSGALAAMALGARPGNFAAAADLGGDPDPLRELDTVVTLGEPARSWWIARLGDPATEAVRRARTRMLMPTVPSDRQLLLAGEPAAAGDRPAAFAALWEFLSTNLATPP